MHKNHGWPDNLDISLISTDPLKNMSKQEIQKNDCPVRCNFCDEKFKTRRCVMVHKKVVQTEKVAVCWNFVEGNCDFGDKPCWFNQTIDTI